jgi:hypothetical protein
MNVLAFIRTEVDESFSSLVIVDYSELAAFFEDCAPLRR